MQSGGRVFALLLLTLPLPACARRPAQLPGTALGTPDDIQRLVRLALTLDAAGDRAADTLYAPGALVVRNARVRLAAPRFAGVGFGGRVAIASASVTVEGRFAWVLMDYRWLGEAGDQQRAEVGRATFVCELRSGNGGGWRIIHAHSSQPLPWER